MAKSKRERQLVDIQDLIEEIDQYPEAAGIAADVWAEMNYTQKIRLLVKRQIASVQGKIDALGQGSDEHEG